MTWASFLYSIQVQREVFVAVLGRLRVLNGLVDRVMMFFRVIMSLLVRCSSLGCTSATHRPRVTVVCRIPKRSA